MVHEEKYISLMEKFFEKSGINTRDEKAYLKLVEKIQQFDKYIVDWDNKDLEQLILNESSKSELSIQKYVQFFKNIYKFACKEEKIIPKNLYLIHGAKYYLNYEKLNETIINEQQYRHLKNILTEIHPDTNEEYNYRDKVIVELAWLGLKSDEIKKLKINDIVFTTRYDKSIAIIKLEDRETIITDEEVINDIKKTIIQEEYLMYGRGNKPQLRKFKETDYLIKPVITNVGGKDYISNPTQPVINVLRKLDPDEIKGIDLTKLNIENIRKSATIERFKNPNVKIEDMQELLGKKTGCDLYRLQEYAKAIRKMEERDRIKNKENNGEN